MILKTDRLLLRELEEKDFSALCGIVQDENVMYAYGHAFDDGEARDWLNRQLRRYEDYGFGLWAVELRETGRFIGQCGLTMQDWAGREVPEVGYLFRQDCWGRGFATEAASACRDYAFTVLDVSEVYAIIRDTNIASQKVAKRCGMELRGSFVKQYHHTAMPHLVFSVAR